MDKERNDIFVSFSFADYDLVNDIVKTLKDKYGFKVWMCSKDLYGGDLYAAIIPGEIRNAKLFLFMHSEHSLVSKEIYSEILTAWKANKSIIPFLLDHTDLEGTMDEYFLQPENYVDGTVPPLEKQLDELSQALYDKLEKYNETTHLKVTLKEKLLPSNIVYPTNKFVGRDDIFKEIDEKYKQGYHLVFLSGVGGIGKTQIAKKYVFDHKNEYDTVVFVTYDGDYKSLIINDSNFITRPETKRKLKEANKLETDEEFFERKLEKIKSLSNERTLIVIDNFDDAYRDEFDELFNGPYRLLITTRVDYSDSDFAQVEVKPFESDKELIDLFFSYYDGDVVEKDDKHLIDLIKMVNCHTYTIELLAKHMAMSYQTVDEMISSLKKQGIMSLNEKIVDAKDKTSVAYQNLLKLYNVSKLSEPQISALRFLLFTPIDGIRGIYIKKWGGDDILMSVRELVKLSWVIKTDNKFALHPIVREIAKNNIKIDYEHCKQFLDNYDQLITHESSWNFMLAEKEAYAAFAYKILEFFPEITGEIEELYYDIECLLSFSVNPKLSLSLAKKIYEYYKNKNGENDYYTIRSEYKIGWDHIFNSQLPNSLENAKKWIIPSFEKFQRIDRPLNTYEKISFYNCARHIAKVYQFLYAEHHCEEDFDKALYYAKWSVEKLLKEEDEELKKSRLPSMYIQVSDVYLVHNDFEEALEYELKAEEACGDFDDDELYHHTRRAKSLLGLKRYNEALEISNRCLNGYIEKDGKYHNTTLETYYICLNCCQALGNEEKAKECESEIANIKKVLFA